MGQPLELLQGTLDMLILKAVSLGPLHGYGVLLRIQQISKERLRIEQGSLYPALYRLEPQGWVRNMTRRSAVERDMDAEIQFHIESYSADLVRTGMAPDEALRRARLELG